MHSAENPIPTILRDELAAHCATDAPGSSADGDASGGRRGTENPLTIDVDDEAFDRLYGFVSHPIPFRTGRCVAVRVVSQFGEESSKVLQP